VHISPSETLVTRLQQLGDISLHADKLEPVQKVANVFDFPIQINDLQLFVQLPTRRTASIIQPELRSKILSSSIKTCRRLTSNQMNGADVKQRLIFCIANFEVIALCR
jgi:hypothetical protein